MSATQCFALCIDCWEFHYGITDKNGVYSRDSGSSNHYDHAVHVFGVPDDYPPPIRNVLASLHAGLPISNGRLQMLSLACAIHALQPTNGISVKPRDGAKGKDTPYGEPACVGAQLRIEEETCA
jgi:hypothetical protein